ncbi:Lysine exporter protein (LYSE/YGGA) [Hyella patelloides LEGE 07179]|uniref:Lysine exporter protein (LYSE/YGGA) n=1 Tax=Hyella patelloides LEGE 07179 TaxID=945734 RepID=A0A563VNL1_9CYAN|nr:LysE family transporter [Hyella patelloides]VEP13050.1 Lysine exporter protein (LYSE/YGGA) [Hyella patelloides LEGE 07179]
MEINLLLRGWIFGLAIAAPVGPIGVLCIRQTLAYGWFRGFICGLGAATADAIYGCIAGFGLTFITDFLLEQKIWLRLIGGIFLCYLGVKTFLTRIKTDDAQVKNANMVGLYTSTLLLTLTNPATILTFAAIFSGMGSIATQGNYVSSVILVTGIFFGSGFWWLLLSMSMILVKAKLALTNLKWINRISGVVIIVFGLIALVSIKI